MAINEQWIPVILEGVSWVKEKLGPSKKELKIQISDLQKQVQALSAGNTALVYNQGLIIEAVLNHLKSDNNYTINADTIVFIGENMGSVDVTKPIITDSYISGDVATKKVEFDVSKIFEGVDEEITLSRATKPSDRR